MADESIICLLSGIRVFVVEKGSISLLLSIFCVLMSCVFCDDVGGRRG